MVEADHDLYGRRRQDAFIVYICQEGQRNKQIEDLRGGPLSNDHPRCVLFLTERNTKVDEFSNYIGLPSNRMLNMLLDPAWEKYKIFDRKHWKYRYLEIQNPK